MREQLRRAANMLVFCVAGISMLATSPTNDYAPEESFSFVYSASVALPPATLSNAQNTATFVVRIDASGSEVSAIHPTTARLSLRASHSDPSPQLTENNTPWVTASANGQWDGEGMPALGGAGGEVGSIPPGSRAFLQQVSLGIPTLFEGNCTEGAPASDPCVSSTTLVIERAITADHALTTTVTGVLEVMVEVPASDNDSGPLPWSLEVAQVIP